MEQTPKNSMTKQEKEQLFRALWSIADVLRGSMTADNFRDYMLSLLFYRYISARYESTVRTEMGGDLPEDMSLLEWYKENEADVQEFEKMMLQSTHYIIKPEFANWLAHKTITCLANLVVVSVISKRNLLKALSKDCSPKSIWIAKNWVKTTPLVIR